MRDLWASRRWLAFGGVFFAVLYGRAAIEVQDWLGGAAAIAIALPLTLYVVGGSRLLGATARRAWHKRRRARPLTADLLSILTLSPYGFEEYCGDLLERMGYQATVTKQTGDQGVDVELRAKDGRLGVAQCKQTPHTKVSRPAVQQLYGEMISRRATFGYLITTGSFTAEARAWAKTKTITLVDRDELLQMASRGSASPH